MPETADAGLITLSEGRAETAVLASAAVDGPFAAPPPALARAGRRQRRQWGWYRLISPVAVIALRQSLGVAWLALVVAEQVNANAGLGFMISQATQFLRNDVILVALAVYAVLGLITDALVRLLERRALAWRRGILG
jgi:sulfonate transport system permease protein